MTPDVKEVRQIDVQPRLVESIHDREPRAHLVFIYRVETTMGQIDVCLPVLSTDVFQVPDTHRQEWAARLAQKTIDLRREGKH